MRTKVIRRLATGTCSVCLCYGLAVQALNGEMSAEAVTPELLTSAPALTAEPTQTPELPAFRFQGEAARQARAGALDAARRKNAAARDRSACRKRASDRG